MKKLLLILVITSSTQLLCMEKDQQLFPWDQLPIELKADILKKTIAIKVQSSIDCFKKIRLVSKEFNTKQTIIDFLEALNSKFAEQEIRSARALHNQHAKEWLSKKYPKLVYEPIHFADQKDLAIKLIQAKDIAGLKKLLLDGYDPQDIKLDALTLAADEIKIPVLELLISFGASANDPIDIFYALNLAKRQNGKAELSQSFYAAIHYLNTERSETLSEYYYRCSFFKFGAT